MMTEWWDCKSWWYHVKCGLCYFYGLPCLMDDFLTLMNMHYIWICIYACMSVWSTYIYSLTYHSCITSYFFKVCCIAASLSYICVHSSQVENQKTKGVYMSFNIRLPIWPLPRLSRLSKCIEKILFIQRKLTEALLHKSGNWGLLTFLSFNRMSLRKIMTIHQRFRLPLLPQGYELLYHHIITTHSFLIIHHYNCYTDYIIISLSALEILATLPAN